MKAFWMFVLFLVIGTALTTLVFSSNEGESKFSGKPTLHGDGMAIAMKSRKLKANRVHIGSGKIDLEDYKPADSAPSSKASFKPGPIEHNAPIMPFVPKAPPPPAHPKPGDLP